MKRFFSIILTLIIVMSTLSISVTAVTSDSTEEVVSSKINDVLKEKMNEYTDDEYIPVYVWLQDIGDSAVYDVLSKKLGAEISSTNEQSYIEARVKEKLESYKEIISEKESILSEEVETVLSLDTIKDISAQIKDIRTQAGISSIMTDSEIKICIEEGMDIEKIIELSEQNQFLSDWRSTRKTVNGVINTAFEAKLDEGQCRNIYIDPALPYAELECKKSYITTLATITEVTEIGYYEEVELVDDIESEIETEIITEEIASTQSANANGHIVSGNYLMTPHETLGYTGAGVRVGVIEVSNMYNPADRHLAKANITSYEESTETAFTHGTKVLSVLCGQSVKYYRNYYQGIAPDATVFYASFSSSNISEDGFLYYYDFRIKLFWMIIEKNVSVVNMSFGTTVGSPSELETYIDCIIQQYRVACVTSAGNNGVVTSPGISHNIITVGNVSNTLDNAGKYLMVYDDPEKKQSSSGYYEISHAINKPDLSAFGTNITMVDSSGTVSSVWSATGTSFSAPMVTGTIALMFQANPNLIGHPDAVKTILVQTAEEDKIGVDYNDLKSGTPTTTSAVTATGIIRNRSGAGLLNIEGALNATLSGLVQILTFNMDTATAGTYWTSDEYYFEAGKDIELAMVFEKYTHEKLYASYATNIDIQIIDENNAVVMTMPYASDGTNINNNVELFNCTFVTAGYYKFKVLFREVVAQDKIEYYFNQIPEGVELPDHVDHKNINVSFMFACDCENSVLVKEEYTDYQSVSCSTCNEILCQKIYN